MENRIWTDGEKAFARHRHEWLNSNIPGWDIEECEAAGLTTQTWWEVILAYNSGDNFDGSLPGDGKPRFVGGWSREEIDARKAECLIIAPPSSLTPSTETAS